MGLLKQYLLEAMDTMERDNIRLKFFGDLSAICAGTAEAGGARREEITGHCDGFQANICLNYGGRDEILRAARRVRRLCGESDSGRTENFCEVPVLRRHP